MATKRLCSMPDCGKPVYGHGYCSKHYARVVRHGDPMRGKRPKRTCIVDGCDRDYLAKGFCSVHYGKNKYNGDPLYQREENQGKRQRFLFDVVMKYDRDECLIWPFPSSPRPSVRINGKIISVCRYICEEDNGPPPVGRQHAAHSCGNGDAGCVTRRHLSWKTPKANQADRVEHGTAIFGESSHFSKLTESDVLAIRSIGTSLPQIEIARLFNTERSNIGRILRRDTWAHVD